MALSKLAAVLAMAAVVVCAFSAAPTATAYHGGYGEKESCPTQMKYFSNCLARDEIRSQCCSVVDEDDYACLCQLKRAVELQVPCHPHRRYGGPRCAGHKAAPPVKLSELMNLPCFQKKLNC